MSDVWANWGCTGNDLTGSDGIVIGSGNQNTTEILAECATSGIPAKYCSDHSENGYSDWFLPSKDELNQMYLNLKLNGLGDLEDIQYWSSSELDATDVWRHDFDSGLQYTSSKDLLAVQCNTRPVRSF